jgi:hypothetical protein
MIRLSFFRLFAVGLFLSLAYSIGSVPLSAQEAESTDFLLPEMEAVFSETRGMIDHTLKVHGYAMEILEVEGGNAFVVGASAILHDIGIPKAREVHGSSSGQYQEIEGPPIAREILTRHQVPAAAVDHICGIVANHHSDEDPVIVTTLEFKILWDSDWLVNFPGRHRESTPKEKEDAIETIFKTAKGKQLARQMFLE